ncbi:hypothetical protein GJ496_000359 [Pomphorhynchus laevis]|nr:hypothetical protein GJ496_000359 [Pomphorhynchus laevis]
MLNAPKRKVHESLLIGGTYCESVQVGFPVLLLSEYDLQTFCRICVAACVRISSIVMRSIGQVINFYDPSTIGSGQINSKINNLLEAKQTDHEHYSYIEDMLINFTCHNTSMIIWEYVSLNRISKFGLTYINSMIIKYCVQNQHHQLSSCQNILQSMSDEEKINFSDTSESELFYTSYMSTLGKHQRYLINLLYKLISKAVPTIDEFIHWLGIKNGREHINYQIEMITDIISVYKNSDLTKTIDNITIC